MLTGLVYAAVVILWAAVLVPRWLRRHDRNSTRRTTVTFHRAMATLERRRARHSASRASHNIDVVVSGARTRVHDRTRATTSAAGSSSAIDRHLDLGVDPFEGGDQEFHLRDARLARSRMVAREAAATRRKQVRQALVALSVIALVLHVMGPLPLLLTALPPIGLALFWFATRHATARPESAGGSQRVRTATASRRSAARPAGRAASRPADRSADRSEDRTRVRTAQRHVEPAMAGSHRANVAAAATSSDVRLLSSDEVAARASSTVSDQWDAVDPPLPSNIVGGRADRRPASRRRGDWTAQRMLEQVEALRAPDQDIDAELGLDDYVDAPYVAPHEHLRAVND